MTSAPRRIVRPAHLLGAAFGAVAALTLGGSLVLPSHAVPFGPEFGCPEKNKWLPVYWYASGAVSEPAYSGPRDSHNCAIHTVGPNAYKRDGCSGPGLRQYSSRLWGLPPGYGHSEQDWIDTCHRTAATIHGKLFPTPTRCVNLGMTGGMWGEWDLPDPECGEPAANPSWGAFTARGCDSNGAQTFTAPMNSPFVNPAEDHLLSVCQTYSENPVPPDRAWSHNPPKRCELVDGVAIGTWVVPDHPSCKQVSFDPATSYTRLEGNATWIDAFNHCWSQRKFLCPRSLVCPEGVPARGTPDGDIWMPVLDAKNAWISIGSANPDRRCKLHTEVAGEATWGETTGPFPVTGNPTTVMCCP